KGCGSIHVRPIVKISPGVKFKGGFQLQARPNLQEFNANKSKFSFELKTSDIRGTVMQECLAGSFLVGQTKGTAANPSGSIICKCMPGFQETGKDPQLGLPICTPTHCKAGTVFVGFDKDNAPLCAKLEEKDYACNQYPVPPNGVVKCPAGSKLRA